MLLGVRGRGINPCPRHTTSPHKLAPGAGGCECWITRAGGHSRRGGGEALSTIVLVPGTRIAICCFCSRSVSVFIIEEHGVDDVNSRAYVPFARCWHVGNNFDCDIAGLTMICVDCRWVQIADGDMYFFFTMFTHCDIFIFLNAKV
jgi:hypothetical protein